MNDSMTGTWHRLLGSFSFRFKNAIILNKKKKKIIFKNVFLKRLVVVFMQL